MRLLLASISALALLNTLPANNAQAQSLKGSLASMKTQNSLAHDYDYTFLPTSSAVNKFVDSGYLVRVSNSSHLVIHNVSYPYSRPEVKLFLERLSTQYHNACNEKLTVTSLTRPLNKQPSNASNKSVHPTGMAVDLRIPRQSKCRAWLESTLLYLERSNVLDVTRERYPPHYHVAVFTKRYQAYVDNIKNNIVEYTVRRGDTLSKIASKNGTTIAKLRIENGLTKDLIRVGQVLQIPNADNKQVAVVSKVMHRVRRGDTLWRISNLYGTSVADIRSENGLRNNTLQVGQELNIRTTSNTN